MAAKCKTAKVLQSAAYCQEPTKSDVPLGAGHHFLSVVLVRVWLHASGNGDSKGCALWHTTFAESLVCYACPPAGVMIRDAAPIGGADLSDRKTERDFRAEARKARSVFVNSKRVPHSRERNIISDKEECLFRKRNRPFDGHVL